MKINIAVVSDSIEFGLSLSIFLEEEGYLVDSIHSDLEQCISVYRERLEMPKVFMIDIATYDWHLEKIKKYQPFFADAKIICVCGDFTNAMIEEISSMCIHGVYDKASGFACMHSVLESVLNDKIAIPNDIKRGYEHVLADNSIPSHIFL